MAAKSDLFERLKYLNLAIALPHMIDNGIAPSDHNGIANLLRKGLGVLAFNILEDFIKNRTVEALTDLSKTKIGFDKLPEKLQESAILSALNALYYRSKLAKGDGEDWKLLIQNETLKIHSTKNPTYEFSQFSLASAGPNISADELVEVIKAFGIEGGWNTLKIVSDAIGGGLPDLNQTYKNLASRRHSSAHLASFVYNYQWLESVQHEILCISASFDILLSTRYRQARSDLTKNIKDHKIADGLNYRFLEETHTGYRETLTINGKARKIWPTLDAALLDLQPKILAKNEFLIILDKTKRIKDWRN